MDSRRNQGFTYQTRPGILLLPEAWAGAPCREISGHQMVSVVEQWLDLAARSPQLAPTFQRASATDPSRGTLVLS